MDLKEQMATRESSGTFSYGKTYAQTIGEQD